MGKITQKARNHLMDVKVSELSNCLTDHQIMDKHNIPNTTFYRYKKLIKNRITDTLVRQTDEDLALCTLLLERRFSVGYQNARVKAVSSSSGDAYHFESLARQYAWDIYTLQREGVIAAVQQANHFAVAGGNNMTMTNNNNKTRPSCIPVPYPAGVIYKDENREKEREELELLQKRYWN